MIETIALILAGVFFLLLSGLFAGAETGVYQLSRLRLRLGIEKKRLSYVILGKSFRDSQALLISILTGNNLANYITTSIVTYLLLSRLGTERAAELLATFITAPALFIFAELIPKSLFFYRSDSLMPCIGPVLFVFHKAFSCCGIVAVFRTMSNAVRRFTHVPVTTAAATGPATEHQITAILRDTQQEDLLSSTQSDIISRLALISSMQLSRIMVPISRVKMVEQNSGRQALLRALEESAFTRLVVYSQLRTNVAGFVNVYDCLSSNEPFADLHNFIKPIRTLSADTTVSEAIKVMQKEKQRILLVVRTGHLAQERPVGIVTMKDLLEELLGELTQG